ncbi:hypothetical protein GPROT2_02901 [Gammaproteobacteria bacterium]|nr:phage holin family protein [Gammaproteobacteria bacterium]QOJ31610.1 MAG: phage holin family protein [Gammaproteobacteria bacterium]CAG0944888.1 hypothetical protein GPROT2_02901 [Gammaproteobacteria bacterium]
MDEQARGPIARFIGSVSAFLATILTIGRTRLELFTVELQLEVRRLAELALWAFIAVCAASVAFVMAGVAIIVTFWDDNRELAAFLVAAVYFATALAAVIILRAKLRRKPPMLHGTLAELARDSERLDRSS